MSTILIAWELGAGWGHVARLRPIAESLRMRGHDVVVALRDVATTGATFTRVGVPCVAAPFKLGWPVNRIRPAIGFAHILHNVGFADENELASLVTAWDALFDLIQPDVTLVDHSPTALLASRGRSSKCVVVGDGFCCPPAMEFLPVLAPWRHADVARLHRDELDTLAVANRVLDARGVLPMHRLSDLYNDVDLRILTTIAELDHFGPRTDAQYHGPGTVGMGVVANWPHNKGPRAIAYLRPFRGLPEFIRALDSARIATLLYCPGLDRRAVGATSYVHLVDQPIDLRHAARFADVAILNGTHASTAEMLLSGVPLLQLPLHMEQQLVAYRSSVLGASLTAELLTPTAAIRQVCQLIEDAEFRRSARGFAERYRHLDTRLTCEEIVNRIEHSLKSAA